MLTKKWGCLLGRIMNSAGFDCLQIPSGYDIWGSADGMPWAWSGSKKENLCSPFSPRVKTNNNNRSICELTIIFLVPTTVWYILALKGGNCDHPWMQKPFLINRARSPITLGFIHVSYFPASTESSFILEILSCQIIFSKSFLSVIRGNNQALECKAHLYLVLVFTTEGVVDE